MVPSVPLVGRKNEVDGLGAALNELRAGRGSVHLLIGEPGIGKTRVADEVARLATDVRVLWGRCDEVGGAPAYWPWTQVLRALAGEAELGSLGAVDASLLLAILPELERRFPGLEPATGADPAHVRFRLHDCVAGLLRAIAARTPLLVILDDLHAADLSSLLLAHFLARDIRAASLLLLGTSRDAEARVRPEVAEILHRIGREGRTWALDRLGPDETAEVLGRTLGRAPAPEVVAGLHRSTEGNPFFLCEYARLLQSGRSPSEGLPDGVQQVVRERLALLGQPTRETLAFAAVLGREFTLQLLASIAGMPRLAIAAELRLAEAAGVVRTLEPGRYAFVHVLVRDALYGALAPEVRAERHARIAAVLESAPEPPLSAIAEHLLEAACMLGAERAAMAVVRAADHAVTSLAYEDAAALVERGLAVFELYGEDPRAKAELLIALGLARIRAGDRAGGHQSCVAAADLARSVGDGELLAKAAVTYGSDFMPAVVDPTLCRLLREGLAGLPPGPSPLRVRVMARLSAALQPADDESEPLAMAAEAVAMARALDDPGALRAALNGASSAMSCDADPNARRAINSELTRLAQEGRDPIAEIQAVGRLVFDCLDLGDVAAADRAIAAFFDLAERLGRAPWRFRARLFLALRATMNGRFTEADAHVAEATAIASLREDPFRYFHWMIWRHARLLTAEAYDDALPVMNDLVAMFARVPDTNRFVAPPLLRLRHLARAGRLRPDDPGIAELLRYLPWILARVALSTMTAEILAFGGDREAARSVYAALLPRGDRLFGEGHGSATCEGPIRRQLGLLAERLGAHAEADAHFERALEQGEALGLRPYVARTSYDFAAVLARRGGDPARVARLVARAASLCRELGMLELLARVEAIGPAGAEASGPTASEGTPTRRSGSDFTLTREGEIWTVQSGSRIVRLKDSLGLRMLACLLQRPGSEVHVLELVAPGEARSVGGDAGEMLDPQALAAYRSRALELREELEEAERWGDLGRVERAREELELIASEVGRATGIGGRLKKAADQTQRARINVQRRIKDAIERIAEGAPEVGTWLGRTVRTGVFCAYEPIPESRGDRTRHR